MRGSCRGWLAWKSASSARRLHALCMNVSASLRRMTKTLQVRDVPEAVHDALVGRAAHEGLSLSQFLRREFERIAQQRTLAEIFAEINERLQSDGGATLEEAVSLVEQGRAERPG